MDGNQPARKLSAVVAQDGVIALPPEAAERLGAKPGDMVEIELEATGGVTVLRNPPPPLEPVDWAKFRGIGKIPGGLSVDEYMRLIRDDIDA